MLETPLRQDSVCSPHVASEGDVLESEPSCQRSDVFDMSFVAQNDVVHNLETPVIVHIPNCPVAISANLVILLCDRSSHGMGMEIASGGGVAESNDIAVLEELDLLVVIVFRLLPWSG